MTTVLNMSEIAKMCHEVNKIWCISNDDNSQPSWEDAPDWQKQSAIDGVKFHLNNPDASDRATHENWMAQKINDGWTYGELKDSEAKTHPCLVEFDELPIKERKKDALFRAVVHALAE